jgi:hypothetical protein
VFQQWGAPSWLQPVGDLFQGAGAGAISTVRGGTQLLHKAIPAIPEIPESYATPPDTFAGKAGKFGEQAAEFFLPGGIATKAEEAGVNLASKLPGIWGMLGRTAARAGAQGIPAAGISAIQSGGDPGTTAWGGGSAAAAAAFMPPLVRGVTNVLGATTGVGANVVRRALSASKDLVDSMEGRIGESQILQNARDALSNAVKMRGDAYEAALAKISQNTQPISRALNSTRQELMNALRSYGATPTVQIMPLSGGGTKAVLDPGFQNSGIARGAESTFKNIIDDVWNWGDQTPLGLDRLKRRIAAYYQSAATGQPSLDDATRLTNGFSDRMADHVRGILTSRVPGYQQMTQAYTDASKLLRNFGDLSLGSINDGTAMRKLMTALHQRNEFRTQLLQTLNQYAPKGMDLPGQIAGHALSSGWSRGIVGAMHGAALGATSGALGWLHGGTPEAAIAGSLAFASHIASMSPYLVGEMARLTGKVLPYVPAAAGAAGSQAHQMLQIDPNWHPETDPSVAGYNASPYAGVERHARGGRIQHYDDGGDVEDDSGSNDPTLRDIQRKRMIQLGQNPGQFYQQPIQIHPERWAAPDYQPPRDPRQPPPPARPPLPPKPIEQQLQEPFLTRETPDDIPSQVIDTSVGGLGQGMRGVERYASTLPNTTQGWMQFLRDPATSGVSGRELAGATHDVAAGGFAAATPFMMGSAVRNPVTTAATLGLGMSAQNTVEEGLQTLGLPKEYAQVAGDFTGVIAGAAAHAGTAGGSERLSALRAYLAPELEARWQHMNQAAEAPTDWGGIREGLDTSAQEARERLRTSGAMAGATTYGGIPSGENVRDWATLIGANVGSGVIATGEAAAARTRQIKNFLVQDRARQLSPEQQDAFQQAKEKYPEASDTMDYLTGLEAQKMLATPQQTEAMSRLLRVLPQSEKMASLATAGAEKVGWYRGSAQALQDVFGDDAPRFSQLLAALSPRISVEGNLRNALNMWKNWTLEGRPTERADIIRIMAKSVQGSGEEKSAMEAWRNNAVSALTSTDPLNLTLSGPKVDSFQHNLRDHVIQVTNDAWMANAFNVAQNLFQGAGKNLAAGNPGMTTEYAGTSARIRQGAAQAGMLPSQGQEAIWSVAMQLYELARQHNISPQEVLQRNLLTTDVIRKTPDFSTLLRHPEYASILEDAGYGDQLQAMKPYVFQQGKVAMTPQQQQLLMESAGTINDTMSMRDRESRSQQFALPKGWTGKIPSAASKSEKSQATRQRILQGLYPETETGVTNIERIPGSVTGHLPEIARLPPSGREYYTNTFPGQENLQGTDIIHTASGLATMPTRNVQGAYINARGRVESQPGRAIPFESGLTWNPAAGTPEQPVPFTQAWMPDINPQERANLEAAMTAHGLVNAQEAVGNNIMVANPSASSATSGLTLRPEGEHWVDPGPLTVPQTRPEGQAWAEREPMMKNFIVQLEKEASEKQMRALARNYPQYAFPSAGPDIRVLGLGNLIPHTDAMKITKLLGGENFVPAENVGSYVNLADEWNNRPGQRKVVGTLFDKVNQMSPDARAQLDQDIRQTAGDAWRHYDNYRTKKGMRVRDDLMNALAITHKGGLDALETALNNKEFLPGIAAAVMLPRLLQSTQQDQGQD